MTRVGDAFCSHDRSRVVLLVGWLIRIRVLIARSEWSCSICSVPVPCVERRRWTERCAHPVFAVPRRHRGLSDAQLYVPGDPNYAAPKVADYIAWFSARFVIRA